MGLLQRCALVFLTFLSMKITAQENPKYFTWSRGPAIPDADGFAGAYAGVSNGVLLLAGGTNFPGNRRSWTNGTNGIYRDGCNNRFLQAVQELTDR